MHTEDKRKKFLIVGILLFLFLTVLVFFSSNKSSTQGGGAQDLKNFMFPSPKGAILEDKNRLVAPIITITADATTVAPGQPTTISWTAPNATSCADSNGNSLLASSSLSISPTENYAFDVLCTNEKGSTIESIKIEVTTAPIIHISAYPNPAPLGSQSSILWNTINATRCTDDSGKTLRLSDSFSVVVKAPYIFNMNCIGPNGTNKKAVTITLAPPKSSSVATNNGANSSAPLPAGLNSTVRPTTPPPSPTSRPGATPAPTTTKNSSANITLSASTLVVDYGRGSVISWTTSGVTNCRATTPTGVEIPNYTTGEAGIILMPLHAPLPAPLPLPNNGNVAIRVLEGKTKATLTIRCDAPDGTQTERSITVTSKPPAPDFCKTFGRPKIRISGVPARVNSGSPAVISWASQCAKKCVATVEPWGEMITYPDVTKIIDFVEDQDYNTYTSTRSLPSLGVSPAGGVRVYPGTPDPNPVIPPSNNSGGLGGDWVNLSKATVTLKCTNDAGDTPYSTTAAASVEVIPPPPSCGGWFSCFFKEILAVVVVGAVVVGTGGAALAVPVWI